MSLILASFLSEIYLDLNMLPLGQKGIHVIECKIIEIRPIIYERGLYFLKRILITDFLEHYMLSWSILHLKYLLFPSSIW